MSYTNVGRSSEWKSSGLFLVVRIFFFNLRLPLQNVFPSEAAQDCGARESGQGRPVEQEMGRHSAVSPQAFPRSWLIRINSGKGKEQNLCRIHLLGEAFGHKIKGFFYVLRGEWLKL
ncbi:hypothetical protein CH361_11490 [Leptospira brenneri]|nr:hypothetical protein CH361_11490 [Leptospira brenneri]